MKRGKATLLWIAVAIWGRAQSLVAGNPGEPGYWDKEFANSTVQAALIITIGIEPSGVAQAHSRVEQLVTQHLKRRWSSSRQTIARRLRGWGQPPRRIWCS
jgi:hypothetical protein